MTQSPAPAPANAQAPSPTLSSASQGLGIREIPRNRTSRKTKLRHKQPSAGGREEKGCLSQNGQQGIFSFILCQAER